MGTRSYPNKLASGNDIQNYDSLGSEARAKLPPSARWDDEWNRLVDCHSVFTPVSVKCTHYTPGLLNCLWQGWMLVRCIEPAQLLARSHPVFQYPDDGIYGNFMRTPQTPPSFSKQSVGLTAAPVFMRLCEYHCMDVDPNEPAASGGIQNVWFHGPVGLQEVAQ